MAVLKRAAATRLGAAEQLRGKLVKSTKGKVAARPGSSSIGSISAALATAEHLPVEVREMLCAALPGCLAKSAPGAARHNFQRKLLEIVDGLLRAAEVRMLHREVECDARCRALGDRLQAMNIVKGKAAARLNAQDEVVKSRAAALAEKAVAVQTVKGVLDKAEECMQRCDRGIGAATMEREYIALAQKAIRERDPFDMMGLAYAILSLPSVLHHLLLPVCVSEAAGDPPALARFLSQPDGLQDLSAFLADRATVLKAAVARSALERVASFVDVQTASAALNLSIERRQQREAALLHAQSLHGEEALVLRALSGDARALVAESARASGALMVARERIAQLRTGPLAMMGQLAAGEAAEAGDQAQRAAREAVRRRRCSWFPRKLAALRGTSSAESGTLHVAVGGLLIPGCSCSPRLGESC